MKRDMYELAADIAIVMTLILISKSPLAALVGIVIVFIAIGFRMGGDHG